MLRAWPDKANASIFGGAIVTKLRRRRLGGCIWSAGGFLWILLSWIIYCLPSSSCWVDQTCHGRTKRRQPSSILLFVFVSSCTKLIRSWHSCLYSASISFNHVKIFTSNLFRLSCLFIRSSWLTPWWQFPIAIISIGSFLLWLPIVIDRHINRIQKVSI